MTYRLATSAGPVYEQIEVPYSFARTIAAKRAYQLQLSVTITEKIQDGSFTRKATVSLEGRWHR